MSYISSLSFYVLFLDYFPFLSLSSSLICFSCFYHFLPLLPPSSSLSLRPFSLFLPLSPLQVSLVIIPASMGPVTMLPERACKFACVHALFCQRERERQRDRETEREGGRREYVTCKKENEKKEYQSIVDCRFV